jgi:hypothetical protein
MGISKPGIDISCYPSLCEVFHGSLIPVFINLDRDQLPTRLA